MSRDFWGFGSADDEAPETPAAVPPGYRLARAIPKGAPMGKQLSCRSCGALVASTDNAVSRHRQFHDRLAADLGNQYGMNYSPDNPNVLAVQAESVMVLLDMMNPSVL